MKIINKKCFSYCEDFDGFEEIQENLASDGSCDSYIDYTAMTKESELKNGYGNDPISNRLVELGAGDGEQVLIHLDW